MIGRLDEVVIDCHDPAHLAEFWQRLLGGYVVRQSHEWVALEPPTGITVSFQLVPEEKTVKNRVHLDLVAPDIQPILDAGATLLRARDDEIYWNVLADPEGNEFCLLRRQVPPA